MEDALSWIVNNKEWLFSGAGFIIGAWLLRLLVKKRGAESRNKIRSGKNSTNVIAGGNVKITKAKKK